jgi:hypothetical protein
MIRGGGLLLIGGDSCAVPVDGFLGGSIENGPDAVALLADGLEVDIVRFGGEDIDCPAGRSLSRRPDGGNTGDPSFDLVCSEPTPGRRNFYETDLSISLAAPFHVPCPGGSSNLHVLLENRGLKRFSGVVLLTVSRVDGGVSPALGTSRITASIGEGETVRASVRFDCPARGFSSVEVRLDAYGDDSPSNDTQSVSMYSSPGDVVVTEIMYRPDRGGEWVELYNRSRVAVDLSGWSMTDRSGTSGTIPGGTVIEAGSFLIIACDSADFRSAWTDFGGTMVEIEGAWPRLNDGDGGAVADEVFFSQVDGTMMESVVYAGLAGDQRGRSIERLSADMCSGDRVGIWLCCGARGGATPGRRNYCDADAVPASGMTVSPAPFRPLEDGTVRFSAAAPPGVASYSASIFDIGGKEVARLSGGAFAAPAVSFTWDGRDRRGETVRTGLYICVVEFTGSGGGMCGREKATVAVWSVLR